MEKSNCERCGKAWTPFSQFIVTKKGKFVCTSCYNFVEGRMKYPTTRTEKDTLQKVTEEYKKWIK